MTASVPGVSINERVASPSSLARSDAPRPAQGSSGTDRPVSPLVSTLPGHIRLSPGAIETRSLNVPSRTTGNISIKKFLDNEPGNGGTEASSLPSTAFEQNNHDNWPLAPSNACTTSGQRKKPLQSNASGSDAVPGSGTDSEHFEPSEASFSRHRMTDGSRANRTESSVSSERSPSLQTPSAGTQDQLNTPHFSSGAAYSENVLVGYDSPPGSSGGDNTSGSTHFSDVNSGIQSAT